MRGLPISGFDGLLAGKGRMRWKLLGLFLVAVGEGEDVTRSAAGRLAVEAIWLPSMLLRPGVCWDETDSDCALARFAAAGEKIELRLTAAENGRIKYARIRRWGNPEGAAFGYHDFGGVMEEERTFGGYTIPTRVRAGWYYGSDRFESSGEFFRAVIEEATYR